MHMHAGHSIGIESAIKELQRIQDYGGKHPFIASIAGKVKIAI
jgi:hypothetical protein